MAVVKVRVLFELNHDNQAYKPGDTCSMTSEQAARLVAMVPSVVEVLKVPPTEKQGK